MHRRPCSSVQLMTVWAFLLYKNNSGAMSKIPQSNAGSMEKEHAMEKATLSNSEEGTAGHGDLFPRPKPHKGPCRCLHHSFALLKKIHWASFGLSKVQSLALFQWYINLAGLIVNRDVQLSTDDPADSYMEGSVSSIWSKTGFVIQVKTEVAHKTAGTLQQPPIKAGKTWVTSLPGSLLEAFGKTLIIGFSIPDTDAGEGS